MKAIALLSIFLLTTGCRTPGPDAAQIRRDLEAWYARQDVDVSPDLIEVCGAKHFTWDDVFVQVAVRFEESEDAPELTFELWYSTDDERATWHPFLDFAHLNPRDALPAGKLSADRPLSDR
jgi:hypothetical protein